MLPAVLSFSQACLASSLLRLHKLDEAAQVAEQATLTQSLFDDGGPYAAAVWLVRAETHFALGEESQGLVVLRRAVTLLRTRLAQAPSEERRQMLKNAVVQHRELQQLCTSRLGEEVYPPPSPPAS